MSEFEQQEEMRKHYDESDYFGGADETYTPLVEGSFHHYRTVKVRQLCSPSMDDNVMDMGCGVGTMCFDLAPRCKHVTGIDYSQKAIDICNKHLESSPFDNISFVRADGMDTRLKTESFDVIISADLFEHIYPDITKKIIDECYRLLKKGGKLAIWTPHRGHIIEILKHRNIIVKRDISHVDYKSMAGLKNDLIERKFSIVKEYYAESHIPVFNVIERLTLPFLPFMRRRIAILAEK